MTSHIQNLILENFLNPLVLCAKKGISFNNWFRGNLEGIHTKEISKLLGLDDNECVIGYLYIGTDTGPVKNIESNNLQDFVSIWD